VNLSLGKENPHEETETKTDPIAEAVVDWFVSNRQSEVASRVQRNYRPFTIHRVTLGGKSGS
jgi:hypothetical protein